MQCVALHYSKPMHIENNENRKKLTLTDAAAAALVFVSCCGALRSQFFFAAVLGQEDCGCYCGGSRTRKEREKQAIHVEIQQCIVQA